MINATTINSHDLNTVRIPKGYHVYNQMIYTSFGYINPSGSDGKLQIIYIYYMINATTIKSHDLNIARIPMGCHVYNQMIYTSYGYINPSGSDGKLQITYICYMINATTQIT